MSYAQLISPKGGSAGEASEKHVSFFVLEFNILSNALGLRLLNPVFTELGDPKVPRGSILAYHVAQTCIVLKGLRWEHSEPKIGPNSLK